MLFEWMADEALDLLADKQVEMMIVAMAGSCSEKADFVVFQHKSVESLILVVGIDQAAEEGVLGTFAEALDKMVEVQREKRWGIGKMASNPVRKENSFDERYN